MVGSHIGKGLALLVLLFSLAYGTKVRDIAVIEGHRSNYLVVMVWW
jgi:flagellar P-ring protein precursor FlgI